MGDARGGAACAAAEINEFKVKKLSSFINYYRFKLNIETLLLSLINNFKSLKRSCLLSMINI